MSQEGEGHLQQPGRRILIVDDEADIRDALKDLLEGLGDGLECEVAPDGAAGLTRLQEARYQLVISDYKMPGMDGIEFLERAGEAAPNTPRILITAFPDLQVAVQAINKASIENFFSKPLDPDEILRVVDEIMRANDAKLQREQALARALHAARGAHA